MTRVGVDIGGTKTELVALSGDGQVVARRRAATPRGDYREAIEALAALVLDLEREVGSRCSVGTISLLAMESGTVQ